MLLIFAFVIVLEAVERFFNPLDILYRDAILVSITGLIVNVATAFILHHDHEHSDHNIRAAYLHVIADALNSLPAIFGLTAAMIWDIPFVNTIAAIISSLVIIRWSIGLLRDSGKALLDMENHQHDHTH
jgi:cation diffusion facilitator family transporter